MSKKILALALATIMLFAIGCQKVKDTNTNEPSENGNENENQPQSDGFILKARVNSLTDRGLEVEVIESDYAFGIYWVLTSADTAFIDKDGKTITKSDIKSGDIVEITYGGQVMMSYPPQIVAQKISLV